MEIKKDKAKHLEAIKRANMEKVAKVQKEKEVRVAKAKERAEEYKELVSCLPNHKAFEGRS